MGLERRKSKRWFECCRHKHLCPLRPISQATSNQGKSTPSTSRHLVGGNEIHHVIKGTSRKPAVWLAVRQQNGSCRDIFMPDSTQQSLSAWKSCHSKEIPSWISHPLAFSYEIKKFVFNLLSCYPLSNYAKPFLQFLRHHFFSSASSPARHAQLLSALTTSHAIKRIQMSRPLFEPVAAQDLKVRSSSMAFLQEWLTCVRPELASRTRAEQKKTQRRRYTLRDTPLLRAMKSWVFDKVLCVSHLRSLLFARCTRLEVERGLIKREKRVQHVSNGCLYLEQKGEE